MVAEEEVGVVIKGSQGELVIEQVLICMEVAQNRMTKMVQYSVKEK